MNARERFLGTMRFQEVDRVPYFEQFIRDETIERWRGEGLPPDVDIEEYFGLDHHETVQLSMRDIPRFPGPLEAYADVEVLKEHYDPLTPERLPEDFEERKEHWRKRDYPLDIQAWQAGILQILGVRDWQTLMDAMIAMYDDPKLCHSVIEFVSDFFMECLEKVFAEVQIDFACLVEPIAHNCGPVLSPKMFRAFVAPRYKKIASWLKKRGIDIIILRTTGDVKCLIPGCIEAGINGLWLTESANSGIDYMELRKEFGRDFRLIGGIDSYVLTQGEKAIEAEIMAKVPPLLEQGGYIPTLDNRVRANVPFENYVCYRRLLNKVVTAESRM